MATEIGKLIRAQAGSNRTIFNDRLKDGTRSIKVGGWTKGDYIVARKQLERAGYTAKLVEFAVGEHVWKVRGGSAKGMQVRLHVSEK